MTTTVNAIVKIRSEDPFEVTTGTLDIISSVATLAGGPYGAAAAALCSFIGAIVSANKPSQPSVVEQLSNVVHRELINFNDELQNQKYGGLNRRVLDQRNQLKGMTLDEELDDKGLWNDYGQFLGELASRFERPLPFMYKEDLLENPDVVSVVKALEKYCQAHTCFLALLTVARGRFEDLGRETAVVERKTGDQIRDAKQRLAFLSHPKYLTFLGRLPSGEGKLTKILALCKKMSALRLVESVRKSLELPAVPNFKTVDAKAKEMSNQSVQLKLKGHYERKVGFFAVDERPRCVQFINETNFSIRIVSGQVGSIKANLEFVKDVQPHSSYERDIQTNDYWFSAGGYLIIKYEEAPFRPDLNPSPNDTVIEFALARPRSAPQAINIEDRTVDGFTQGRYTYDHMKDHSKKITYWKKGEIHYMASADFVQNWFDFFSGRTGNWRFVVQDFDPVGDVK